MGGAPSLPAGGTTLPTFVTLQGGEFWFTSTAELDRQIQNGTIQAVSDCVYKLMLSPPRILIERKYADVLADQVSQVTKAEDQVLRIFYVAAYLETDNTGVLSSPLEGVKAHRRSSAGSFVTPQPNHVKPSKKAPATGDSIKPVPPQVQPEAVIDLLGNFLEADDSEPSLSPPSPDENRKKSQTAKTKAQFPSRWSLYCVDESIDAQKKPNES